MHSESARSAERALEQGSMVLNGIVTRIGYSDGSTDDLGTVVKDSLQRTSMNATAAPTPLPETPVTTALSLSSSC